MIRFLVYILISFITILSTIDAAPGSYDKCYKIVKKARRKAFIIIYNDKVYFISPGTPADYYFKVGRYSALIEVEKILKKKARK